MKEGETTTNANGGKQAHVRARMDQIPAECLLLLGECLATGLERYGEGNWKKLTLEENLNHAMVHITRHRMGDMTEPHLVNALARINFALWQNVDSGNQPISYH